MDIGNTIPQVKTQCIVVDKRDKKDIQRLLYKAKEDNNRDKVKIFGEMLYTGMLVLDSSDYKKGYIEQLETYKVVEFLSIKSMNEDSKTDKLVEVLRRDCIDEDMYYNRHTKDISLPVEDTKIIKLKRENTKLKDIFLAWQMCLDDEDKQRKYESIPKPMPDEDTRGLNGFDRIGDLAITKTCDYQEEIVDFLNQHGVKFEIDKIDSYLVMVRNAVKQALCELIIWLNKVQRIVSYSGGKDSTAMLIRMIEEGIKIDKIVFANTGVEFNQMIDYIKKVERYIGRKIDVIDSPVTWDSWFYGLATKGKTMGQRRGFPPTVGVGCWAKRELKIKPLRQIEGEHNIIYLGIAADEKHRMYREQYQHKNLYKFPLMEYNMSEKECIDFLKARGLHNPLYDLFDRLGCWMCPKQSLDSLRKLFLMFPDKWEQLKVYEQDSPHGFKVGYNLKELEERFENELYTELLLAG